jgi:hypothetical protein
MSAFPERLSELFAVAFAFLASGTFPNFCSQHRQYRLDCRVVETNAPIAQLKAIVALKVLMLENLVTL